MTVNTAKLSGYAIIEPLGIFDAKLVGYTIFEPESVNVSRFEGFSIFEPKSANVAKLSGYAIIEDLANLAINEWRDKSSNHFVLTQGGNARPILVLNAINGLPLVKFDAINNQVLNFNNSLDLSGGYSYVGILVRGSGSPTSNVETLGNTSGPNPDAIQWNYGLGVDSGTVYIKNEIGYGKTDPFVMCRDAIVVSATVSASNDVHIFINGIEVTDPGGMFAQATPNGTFNLFGFGDNKFTTGYFGEQKFWKGVLTNFDLLNETSAMMTKWGITVCPSVPPAALALWLDPSDPATITIIP